MEIELAKSYLAERKDKKKQQVGQQISIENNKCRKWMKNHGKQRYLDFKDT